MLNKNVIRFGGNNLGNHTSINNLADYLKQSKSINFIVVSSSTAIYDLLHEQLTHIFRIGVNTAYLRKELEAEYLKFVEKECSEIYNGYITQVLQLLEGITLTGDFSNALKDQVLSYSEKLFSVIFQELLLGKQIESEILLPEDHDFKVSEDYGNATHLSFGFKEAQTIKNFIVPGSYGITGNGKIARTGYSAADYTAAAITAWVNAPKLILWGLDNEFTSADPKIVENTNKIQRLTYAEASELAYFDHYSIHPRTVEPLESLHVPIHVVSGRKEGTVETIINTETFISENIVKGVAHSDDVALLKLDGAGVGLKPGILAKVTSTLHEAGINIKSVITAQTSINFILSEKDGEKALDLVNNLGFNSVKEISVVSDISLIGIIGYGLQQNYGIFAKLFGAIAGSEINVLLSGSGASDLVSYLVVKQKDRNNVVKVIHDAFFKTASFKERKKEIN